MKKKILIPAIILFIILSLVISFILYNNRTVSILYLDINPSIQINLDRHNKIKKVIPLNSDAEKIISSDFKGEELTKVIEDIRDNLKKEGYAEDKVVILMHATGKLENNEVEKLIVETFDWGNLEVIKVDKISKEDEELAKKYNISPAKVAYIKSIDNKNIETEDMVDKSISELQETKERGKYCEKGYNLEGDFCLKEIGKEDALPGQVCPSEYIEYNGKCYKEERSIDTGELECPEDRKLENGKCVVYIEREAEPSKYTCKSGEPKKRSELHLTGDDAQGINDIVCADYSKATHPVSPCEANDGTEYTIVGGVCYWHRAPVIATGCPGKIQVGGFCWDNATGIYICPGINDGYTYKSKDEWCIRSIKFTNPVVDEYKCEEGFTLQGNICVKTEYEDPSPKMVCPSGFTKTEEGRCINKNKTANKQEGYYCEKENTKLKGSTCYIYDIVDAKE